MTQQFILDGISGTISDSGLVKWHELEFSYFDLAKCVLRDAIDKQGLLDAIFYYLYINNKP